MTASCISCLLSVFGAMAIQLETTGHDILRQLFSTCIPLILSLLLNLYSKWFIIPLIVHDSKELSGCFL